MRSSLTLLALALSCLACDSSDNFAIIGAGDGGQPAWSDRYIGHLNGGSFDVQTTAAPALTLQEGSSITGAPPSPSTPHCVWTNLGRASRLTTGEVVHMSNAREELDSANHMHLSATASDGSFKVECSKPSPEHFRVKDFDDSLQGSLRISI